MSDSLGQKKLWIDGAPCDAAAGETFATENPRTGAQLTELPRARGKDVDRAVASARRAYTETWGRWNGSERARVLWRVGELIEAQAARLARLESIDAGKPIQNTERADVPLAADTFYYFSGWATKIAGETIPVRTRHLNYTLRQPLGVIAAITPWNFPLLLAARKVAAALACGNTVVLKPAEEASLTSIELGRLLTEAGAPAGTLNVLSGRGEEAGAALVAHPGVDKIAFTGGTDTGRRIAAEAAPSLKKLSLELGGKCPNIIFADADLDAAIAGAVRGGFYNSGQVCTAGSRLLVERPIMSVVLEGVVEGARKLKVGDPLDAATEIGPLVSSAQRQRVVVHIERARAEKARLLCGGEHSGPGFFVQPSVFDKVTEQMAIAREEIFGPVMALIPFDDVAEAARIADSTEYGLAAGVWTKDPGRAHGLADRLRCGTVWINSYNLFDSPSPYGGMKQSGYGRENGKAVIDEMTQLKSVWVPLS
jgi:aldehyde dehydrogenase (NAD+)/phenylacetaldehyde dehydrogenase